MPQGTNDYNAQKLTPSEVIVSRTLQSKNRFWSNMIWRTGKPALDSEWNLINDTNFENVSNLIRSTTPSGWLQQGINKFLSGNSGTADNLQFYAAEDGQVLDVPNALVNGWPIIVGGVDMGVGGIATDTSLNSITLEAAGATEFDYRYDFAFLEVFRAQVRSRDENNVKIAQNKPSLTEIYAYGNTQFGGTNFIDDIVDETIKPSTDGIETSQRVQIQYRIRVVSGVDFPTAQTPGFADTTNVQGQGANTNPQVTLYPFTNMGTELNDSGLWRSGGGDEASRIALRTVDGYSYAIPMFRIFRRSQAAYSDTGANPAEAFRFQQGNAIALSSGVSDRPDGKFYDGVDATDIIDLRHQVCIKGVNYDEILEKNLQYLLEGSLRSSKRELIHYDSISDVDVEGYVDFRSNEGASGKRIIWSDAATDQEDIFGEVTTTTTDNSLDVYIIKNNNISPNWANNDEVIVQVTPKLPAGTVIKATPRFYVEDKDVFTSDLSTAGVGSWSGLNTPTATFTFNTDIGTGRDLWVYYDISLPAGQGLTYLPDELVRVKYTNNSAFPNGTIVRGEILKSKTTRFQDLANHPFENKDTTTTFEEIISTEERKQVEINPLAQTTSTRDGGTRTLEVKTTIASAKIISIPYKLQHLKGIFSSATSGTEVATQAVFNIQVDSVDDTDNSILIDEDFFVTELTSLKYDASGAFVGAEIELLVANGGAYNPVYEHKQVTADPKGSVVRLYDTSGNQYDIVGGSSAVNFRWTGKRISVRNGSGYGYDINTLVIDCSSSDNNALITSDNQQFWIDMDYLAPVHNGAEIRLNYQYLPYQGYETGSQELEMIHKRQTGVFFNNGTGGGDISLDSSGTSNVNYTPMSSRLPGSLSDYLRDGAIIDIASKGLPRYLSDAYFTAAYELYGWFGGGSLWAPDYTMPATPETTSRGFLGSPVLEVIFELPVTDQTYAEFILPLLVRNKDTGEVYLMVQIGNKGVQKTEAGDVSLEIYRLDEKLLLK